MLQIRAKKLPEGYAVNVDYIDIDTYSDVLNMLCAINEEARADGVQVQQHTN